MAEKKSTRIAYGEALAKLGAVDQNVLVCDADLAHATMTASFADKYPDRFYNFGIAEGNMMTASAAMAQCGYTVFCSTFAVFGAGRAFEQVRNAICYSKANVKLGCSHAGPSCGEDGGSHQAVEDISLMRTLPNMTVLVPADAVEMEKAVFAAAKFQGPVYIRTGRLPTDICTEADTPFEIGKANVLSCDQVSELIRLREKMGITSGGVPACAPKPSNTVDVVAGSPVTTPGSGLKTFGQVSGSSPCGCAGGSDALSEEDLRQITQAVIARLGGK